MKPTTVSLLLVFVACAPAAIPSNTSYRYVECSKSPTECFDSLRRDCPSGFVIISQSIACGTYGTPLIPGPVPWYSFEASCYPTSQEQETPYNPCYVR